MSSQPRNVVPSTPTRAEKSATRTFLLVLTVLLVAVIAVNAFHPALSAGFINLDDDIYVSANPHVQQGLSVPEIGWAWTSNYLGYEIPLTWMSYMLDTELFGTGPWGYHLTNVILHAANAVLLLAVLQRATGSAWRAALAAALWAVHPLRVESVAWVTERKDVLAGFFALATLYAYVRYAQTPSRGRFAAVVVGYCLSLLAKPPLAAALPISVWLLDYWPLGRMDGGPEAVVPVNTVPASRAESRRQVKKRRSAGQSTFDVGQRSPWSLAVEKWPLLTAAIVAGVILAIGMRREGQFQGDVIVPWGGRLANAAVAPVRLLERFVWFKHLAVIYPLRPGWPAASVAAAAAFLIGVSALVIWQRKRFPWLAVGWFWFAVNIAPSLGLVQGGLKVAMGDRYTYFPAIGLLLMAVWSIPDSWVRTIPRRVMAASLSAACLIALILSTWSQLAYWHDSITLFRHALAVTNGNWMAHHDLAVALSDRGENDEALEHFNQSLQINPKYRYAWENGAILLNRMKRWSDAAHYAGRATALEPDSLKAHLELETALMRLGRFQEAIHECNEILRLNPSSVDAHMDMAIALFKLGRPEQAIANLQKAVELDPNDAVARENLARAIYQSQHPPTSAPAGAPDRPGP